MFGKRNALFKVPKKVIPFSELKYEEVITEHLDYTHYTADEISKIKSAAYRRNYKNGKYVSNCRGLGPDNPFVIGMPDCSNSLVYDGSNDRWILTDGLGNGWIR